MPGETPGVVLSGLEKGLGSSPEPPSERREQPPASWLAGGGQVSAAWGRAQCWEDRSCFPGALLKPELAATQKHLHLSLEVTGSFLFHHLPGLAEGLK